MTSQKLQDAQTFMRIRNEEERRRIQSEIESAASDS